MTKFERQEEAKARYLVSKITLYWKNRGFNNIKVWYDKEELGNTTIYPIRSNICLKK